MMLRQIFPSEKLFAIRTPFLPASDALQNKRCHASPDILILNPYRALSDTSRTGKRPSFLPFLSVLNLSDQRESRLIRHNGDILMKL